MGSGGKGGSQTIGYRYYMSLLMGVGRGPLDEIVQINVGDVRAWPVPDGDSEQTSGLAVIAQGPDGTGNAQYEDGTVRAVTSDQINTVSGTTTASVNAPNLFGGDSREGGIQGKLEVLMGAATQVVPAYIKSLIGGRVPDFRGVTTFFFDGLLCSMNPYPKTWKFRVRRTTSGWDGPVWQPSLAVIWMRDGSIKAMNPMHIIYECLTNRDWGRGYSRTWLNDTRLMEIAQVLHGENFGMCLRWNRSGELGEFIQMIINHIGGSLYVDRTNGLISMDLLRGDYDAESLPTFTYSTGLLSVEESDTAAQEDVINEVIVAWKDPIQDKERSVRVHNLASLQSSGGGKNPSKVSYEGLPTSELAARVAQRDLKASAASLKRFKVTLDRRAWRIKPGDVFRISAPDKDIYNVIVRAGKTRSGTNTSGKIVVEAVIDVFGLPSSSFVGSTPIEWAPPSKLPQSADIRFVREATWRDLVRSVGPGDLLTVTDDVSTIATLAAKPTDLVQGYRLSTRAEGEDFEQRGSGSFLPAAKLATPMGRGDTTVAFKDAQEMGLVEVGMAVQIGHEICVLKDIDLDNMTMVVGRGCVDTVPSSHPVDDLIFFMADEPGTDAREYVSGENVEVKVLPYTSSAQLSANLAIADPITIAARQARPWPPANVRINGDVIGDAEPVTEGDLLFTWAHRDRKLIQDQLIDTTEPSVGPEAGTTYNVRVYDGEIPEPVRTVTDLTGDTWTYTSAMASADGIDGEVRFVIESARDGLVSFQRHRLTLIHRPTGYGNGYGNGYGE